MKPENLRRVRQFCEENPAFTEGGMRWLIHNAANNGLDTHRAIVRIGGAVYIDRQAFGEWLEAQPAGKRQTA